MLLKLPLDLSTFSEMRRRGYLYVDKTKHIYAMVTSGRRYFLARPRRFGKSLLLSTLQEVLNGHRDLFEGLWIDGSDYDWHPHAVITLDFSGLPLENFETWKKGLLYALRRQARLFAISIDPDADAAPSLLLQDLVQVLVQRGKSVALLIDEYDAPITRTLYVPVLCQQVHDYIRDFFSVIKSLDACLPFVFITGVSAFAKAGIFSGINNLQMMMLKPEFSDICGYTEEEIDQYFYPYITAWAAAKECPIEVLREEIQQWYNGYSFGIQGPKVYNPFSLLNALANKKLENFWFESGTPEFLVKTLERYSQEDPYFIEMKPHHVSKENIATFKLEKMPLPALMFQTGYMTIKAYDIESNRFILDYPNKEVAASWQLYMLMFFTRCGHADADEITFRLHEALKVGDMSALVDALKKLFAHIPYHLHIAKEAFYHALLQMAFTVANLKAQSEFSTSHGRIDLVVELAHRRYIIEVKFKGSALEALKQIERRKYYGRFLHTKPLTLVGMAFDKAAHHFDITYAAKEL